MLKTFISYKWQDDAHNQWVEKFAGDLRAAGIDAQLDKWEIRGGESLSGYVASRINEADVVLCIITDEYVENVDAPNGQGGFTQFEMQMAVGRRMARDKVRLIGIYRQGSKQPSYLRDHLYFDFRDDSKYAERLQALLDDLRGKSKRPPLGFPQLDEWQVWENSIGIEMVLLPAGDFLMGSPDSDKKATPDEKPQHVVRITVPFLMGVYPVTQRQYCAAGLKNPSRYFADDDRRPVESVNWDDAVFFCNLLSQKEHLPPYYDLQHEDVRIVGATGYRLPTEAEWEYACRAGSTSRHYFSDTGAELDNHAWYGQNSGDHPHPVGEKPCNAWGLFDMYGNVGEWCWDWYGDKYYRESPQADPLGPLEGSRRVHRGGSWQGYAEHVRSGDRMRQDPDLRLHTIGFRVARSSA